MLNPVGMIQDLDLVLDQGLESDHHFTWNGKISAGITSIRKELERNGVGSNAQNKVGLLNEHPFRHWSTD